MGESRQARSRATTPEENQMNTRTIAIAALVIAVILLFLLFVR